MVLKAKLQKGISWNSWIEKLAHSRFKANKFYTLSKYLSPERASNLLAVPIDSLLNYLSASAYVHGVLINTTLYVHPEGVFKLVGIKYRQVIKKVLVKHDSDSA